MSTITVSTTAGLATALQTAQPGEVIQLTAGTYSSVAVSGLNIGGTVTIQSQDSSNPALISGLNISNSSGLTFINLTFTTVGSSDPYYADRVTGSSNVSFNSCLFSGAPSADPSTYISGLLFENNSNISVSESRFQYLLNGLINLNNSNATFSNNNFTNLSGDGIDNGGSSNVLISGNQFTNFATTGAEHPDAIQFWTTNTTVAASNIVISNNTIVQGTGAAVQGIFMTDDSGVLPFHNVTISNNSIVGGMWDAIDVIGALGLTINGNQLSEVAGSSYVPRLMVSEATNAALSNNVAPDYVLGYYGTNTNLTETNDATNTTTAPPVGPAAVTASPPTVAGTTTPTPVGPAAVTASLPTVAGTTTTTPVGPAAVTSSPHTVAGTAGNDSLSDGGVGNADTLIGNGGSDTFLVNNTNDVVIQSVRGHGTILTSVSFTAPANVQVLTAAGTQAVTLVGNNLGDMITANSGHDVLTGGLGRDVFIFAPGEKLETVSNFNPKNDMLDISAYLKDGEKFSTQGSTIVFSDGDMIQLIGVHTNTLHLSGHFIV